MVENSTKLQFSSLYFFLSLTAFSMWFYNLYQYYYIVLILQGLCVFHAIRKGNDQKWIWIIVFLPLIGSVAYIFTEVVRKDGVNKLQSGVAKAVNPGGSIKKLEKNFKFSDTFSNRIALGQAYLASQMNQEVIDLIQPALTGIFYDNEDGVKLLIHAYFNQEKYKEVTELAPRISNGLNFSKSETNLVYAFSLEKMEKFDLAEKEYESMNHRYSNFEARYNYGCFLIRRNRMNDAKTIFNDMIDEAHNMTWKEKSGHRSWIGKAQDELKRLG